MGGFVDQFGSRIAYAFAALAWSAAAGLTVFARSAVQFAMWRGLLGFRVSFYFSPAIKSVSGGVGGKNRGFATGGFNSGPNNSPPMRPPGFVVLSPATWWCPF